MNLYLVQHGDAVSKETDPERPLSPEGIKAVETMARQMQSMHVQINEIFHSGKLRAQQTAQIFADALMDGGEIDTLEGIEPNDNIIDFLASMSELDPETMIVGHLPFMAKLVSFLVTAKEEPAIVAYEPGSVVHLERNQETLWHIDWMLRPDCLRSD